MAAEAMDPAQEFEAKLLCRQKAMHEATARGDSAIQQCYCGAVVFITGGSGFLGKQLTEKLFRATKTSKVFILLRSKKGKAMQQRLNEMLQDPLYDLLRDQQPDFADRIVPVAGDVAELRLGMSDNDWKTVTEQTNIIFHIAATTRFDETLRVATLTNVRGTREAIILGKACKKLKSFVHVSTAYAHARDDLINSELLEDFLPSPVDPETMIKLVETVDEERLNGITSGFITNWQNTYAFAKAVAEDLVKTMGGDMPICIVRPAIVISSQLEPKPGWIDLSAMYGATGIVLGYAYGLAHVYCIDDSLSLNLVPVDLVNNATIAAGWATAKRKAAGEMQTKIYTVASQTRNPGIWGRLREILANDVSKKYPSPLAFWYNFSWYTSNPTVFWIYNWLLHLIPAHIFDGICFVLGKERKYVKLYKKMYKMFTKLSFFTTHNWQLVDNNTASLYDNLSTVDQTIFNFDVNKINWSEFIHIWIVLGVRKYIMKDGLKGTKYAIKKQFVFRILTYVIAPCYIYFLYKIFYYSIVILSLMFKLFW